MSGGDQDKEAEDAAKNVIRRLKEEEARVEAELASREAERKLQERAAEYLKNQEKDK